MSRESLVVSLQSLAIIPINLPYILSMTHKSGHWSSGPSTSN